MRPDVTAYTRPDTRRQVTITLYKTATLEQLLLNTAAAGFELTPYVTQAQHTQSELSVHLHFDQTVLTLHPRVGDLVTAQVDGWRAFTGIIQGIAEFEEQRGRRQLSLTVRTRDGTGLWRNTRVLSGVFPVGTELTRIAESICHGVGLQPAEYNFPLISYYSPHTTAQMADMTPWAMLETVLLPLGLTPFTDALGRVRAYDRTLVRPADVIYPKTLTLQIGGSRARPAANVVKLRWLDKQLTKTQQSDQLLATESITAGFFKLEQKRRVYFSNDRTQRAEATRLVIKQSVNDGLLPVGSESYREIDPFQGEITVTTAAWVPGLATLSIAAMLLTTKQPDGVVTDPVSGTGWTIPQGRIVHGLAEAAILITLMSLGTGVYEVWGVPYDFIHTKNTTEAYNDTAPLWDLAEKELDNDFITDEAHAQAVATRELLYESFAACTWGCEIVDNPQLEIGDILELPDGSRLFITGYRRDLTPGAPAKLALDGFRA